MSRRTILVTGASGLLGAALLRAWSPHHRVVAVSRAKPVRLPEAWAVDVTAPGVPERLVRQVKPDLVVHAAAWTDVDGCEAQPGLAMKVNAEASGRLAAAARQVEAAFIYISTDAVFDGERGGYGEEDQPNPVNHYARSKLKGEHEALSAHPGAAVMRLGLEGWRPAGRPGFIQWVIDGLRRGSQLSICTDWVHTVVFAPNVADVIERLWKAGATGIYHVGAERPASNWDIARETAEIFGLDFSRLTPIASEVLRLPARRPKNVALVCSRLREAIGPVVWDLPKGLQEMRFQEKSGELAALRELVAA